jgi:hypothetical protein
MEHKISLRGEPAFHLEMTIRGYEYPDEHSGPDANWLAGSVEFSFGTGGLVGAHFNVSWRADELELFRDELRKLLDGHVSSAAMNHLEQSAELTIARVDGNVLVSGLVSPGFQAGIRFREIPLAPDALPAGLEALTRAVAAFPARTA